MSAANRCVCSATPASNNSILLLLSPQSPVLAERKRREGKEKKKEKEMAADTRNPSNSSSQTHPYTPATPTQDPNLKTYERFGTSPSSSSYASTNKYNIINNNNNNNGGGEEAVEGSRPQNANLLPGGTMNTAGGNIRETSILEAAKTIKLRDFKELHKKPCARDSFLVGIGAGFGVGGIRAVIGGRFFFFFFSFLLHFLFLFLFIYKYIFTWFFHQSSLAPPSPHTPLWPT